MRLEQRQVLEVEGGTREDCMKILRHECGHAIQHAYQFQRRRRYHQLFGKSSQVYPESYRPDPASRRYVQHLRLYYAQSHPDEDFAETFAVWLQPRATWRKRYHGWPALKKLEYVEELMDEVKQMRPLISSRKQVDPLHSLKIMLGASPLHLLRESLAESLALAACQSFTMVWPCGSRVNGDGGVAMSVRILFFPDRAKHGSASRRRVENTTQPASRTCSRKAG